MGHDLPPALVPKLGKLLLKHLNKAEKKWQKRTQKRLTEQPQQHTAANDKQAPGNIHQLS